MQQALRLGLVLGVFLPLASLTSGCAYLHNRGNDAKDIFDVGLTFSKQPQFGLYCGFQSLLGVGYAGVDGHECGIGQREMGWLPMRYNAGGLVLAGYEQYAFDGKYDPRNPDSPTTRGVGLGMFHYATPRSVVEMLQCAKFVHLGWIGVNLNCKIGELLDFVIGWSTLDIGGDDTAGKEAEPATAPAAAPPPPPGT